MSHEYAIIRSPLGVHSAVPRRSVLRGDDVVGWDEYGDRAKARAEALNKKHAKDIAEAKRRQPGLFDE